jgi:magnesium-transporting ATPase (P-type)
MKSENNLSKAIKNHQDKKGDEKANHALPVTGNNIDKNGHYNSKTGKPKQDYRHEIRSGLKENIEEIIIHVKQRSFVVTVILAGIIWTAFSLAEVFAFVTGYATVIMTVMAASALAEMILTIHHRHGGISFYKKHNKRQLALLRILNLATTVFCFLFLIAAICIQFEIVQTEKIPKILFNHLLLFASGLFAGLDDLGCPKAETGGNAAGITQAGEQETRL